MSGILGETLVFGQHVGGEVELVTYGDEFYARYETRDGYTAVYDLDRGRYCYAVVQGGRFVSSGTPISKQAPPELRRHLREDQAVRNTKFTQRYEFLRPAEAPVGSNVARTLGPNGGLLAGRQVSSGEVRGLTILVEFDDVHTDVTAEDVNALLNGEDYSANGNFCSVRRYYQMMSGGKLDYTNRVVGPIRLARRRSYYISHLLVAEALQRAVDEHNLDLSEFDSLDAGIVDALSFLYAGRTVYADDLWPHNSWIRLTHGGVRTHFYTIQSMGRRPVDVSIGTFTHETGHMLCRFPDLYDYGERDGDSEDSCGLGLYCLMSYGNHLNAGKTPSPICAYLRDLADWCDKEVDLTTPGTYEATHGDYSTVLRFGTDKAHEYFVVENRNREGFDQHLPDAGLAVYRCDTRGSNEYQDGTPEDHYQCALIQADGRLDLENNINGGDEEDLYDKVRGTALADDTTPSSRLWDRSDSGLVLSDISAPGSTITFRTGTAVPPTVVTASVRPDLLIPDDSEDGVRSELHVDRAGTLKRIEVRVDITHSYRGDLEVTLHPPQGASPVILHAEAGGRQDDLHLRLDSKKFEPLKDLKSKAIEGPWVLQVRDLERDDVGRLDEWGITVEYKAAERVVRQEAFPAADIPDKDVTGVTSELTVKDPGTVRSLAVEVEITHTYRGDLQIELVCPSGQRALLRGADGDSQANLSALYTDQTTSALRALVGQETQGTWALHVRDLAELDAGTLDRWAITLRR